RGVLRQVGAPLPGDHSLVDRRVGRVRSVPGVRRGDPHRHLHHERDRVGQRQTAPRGPGPRALPDRAGSAQVSVHGADGPRPNRPRPRTMDDALEGSVERLRRRVRGPLVRRQELTTRSSYTVKLTDPDRVAQTVAAMVLEPEVERVFHDDSYGYRPGRSPIDA